MRDVQLEKGEYGLRAVVTGPWREEITSLLRRLGVLELELNDGKNWRGGDVSFLAMLPQLQSLTIIDLKIASVEPIHSLHQLRQLTIITYCDTEIRFSAFPRLESCSLEWRSRANSLFASTRLKHLLINCYDGKNVDPFSTLTDLESLAILNAPVENLHGLSTLKKLKSLRLARLKRLTSLAGIESLTNLEEFDLHTCPRIESIEAIASLSKLRKLYLNNDGTIQSLKPLESLQKLESVLFYESTNIVDGDLTPLLHQRNLRVVSFRNRRHYSHRREDFNDAQSKS